MSKRRRASELMFGKKRALKYPVNVVAAASGTGTATRGGTITVVASDSAYSAMTSGTNIATLVGSTTIYT